MVISGVACVVVALFDKVLHVLKKMLIVLVLRMIIFCHILFLILWRISICPMLTFRHLFEICGLKSRRANRPPKCATTFLHFLNYDVFCFILCWSSLWLKIWSLIASIEWTTKWIWWMIILNEKMEKTLFRDTSADINRFQFGKAILLPAVCWMSMLWVSGLRLIRCCWVSLYESCLHKWIIY